MDGGIEQSLDLDSNLGAALERGDRFLPERVGLSVARELGLRTPRVVEVTGIADAATLDLEEFEGDRLVVKMLSRDAGHKSDLGGVVICPKRTSALERALESIRLEVAGRASIDGYSISQHVDHGHSPGDEILLGARWTDDFGPVVALGLGGVEIERLAGCGALAPLLLSSAAGARAGAALPFDHDLVRLLVEPYRGRPPRFDRSRLEELVSRLLGFADRWMSVERPRRLLELEFNPVVMGPDGPTALDVLMRPATGAPDIAPPRPSERLRNLLEPRSIAVAGVSQRMNIGHTILDNIKRQGFEPSRLAVIKAGVGEIDGCRCYPDFDALPEPVDLAVLAVAAAQIPDLVERIISADRARSLILIPGGTGERAGSEGVASRLEHLIRSSRDRNGGGPVVNGGNCLGVRSLPGRFDTLFIPGHKLEFAADAPAPLALLSQSGAFAVARASKLYRLNPRYVVSFGNQIDLTLGDYLTYLAQDPAVSVFACYVEGFRPLDGRRFLDAVRAIRRSGRAVVLYRAGRTAAGATVAATHTASVAGSYRVTRDLTERSGGLVADSIEDFEDLVRTFCGLAGRTATGLHLGALSNAGFESVAIADNLTGLELAQFTKSTRTELARIFRGARIDAIVAPANPLDVTPVLEDQAFAATAEAVLRDERVDLGLVGCVPLTGALATLPLGDRHGEDLDQPTSVGPRLVRLWRATEKPWVVTVDGGPLFDPLARSLERAGIPTFRSVDRALRSLARWARFRLGSP